MRKIKEIIIHCSATKEGRNFTVADIDRWHRERGMRSLIEQLKEEYPLATIHGHNEFANKACPWLPIPFKSLLSLEPATLRRNKKYTNK